MQEPSWLEETVWLMNNRHRSINLQTISKECKVSVAWLSRLQCDALTKPSVDKLQTVNLWLKAQKQSNV